MKNVMKHLWDIRPTEKQSSRNCSSCPILTKSMTWDWTRNPSYLEWISQWRNLFSWNLGLLTEGHHAVSLISVDKYIANDVLLDCSCSIGPQLLAHHPTTASRFCVSSAQVQVLYMHGTSMSSSNTRKTVKKTITRLMQIWTWKIRINTVLKWVYLSIIIFHFSFPNWLRNRGSYLYAIALQK